MNKFKATNVIDISANNRILFLFSILYFIFVSISLNLIFDFPRIYYFWQYLSTGEIDKDFIENVFLNWYHPILINLIYGLFRSITSNVENLNYLYLTLHCILFSLNLFFFCKIIDFVGIKKKTKIIIYLFILINPVFILYSYHVYDTILFFTIITGFSYYLLKSIYSKNHSDMVFLIIFILLLFFIRHTYSFIWLTIITIIFYKIYGFQIIKYFLVPFIIISIFQIKNLYFIGQTHYGAPYEVLNENLSFLKKENIYENSEILQILFNSKSEHIDFIDEYKIFNLLPSYQNNIDRKKVLDVLGINYNLHKDTGILHYLEKCSSYSLNESYFIENINSKIKKGYLKFDLNSNKIDKDIFEIKILNIEKEINKKNQIKLDDISDKEIQKCSNNNNWYGVKKINDLRKEEIIDIFKRKPLVPVFILIDNFTTSLNSSLNYYMIEYNIGNNYNYFAILNKFYYPSLNNFIKNDSQNYFSRKLSTISLTKLLVLIIILALIIKNRIYLSKKPYFLIIILITILLSALNIFFGSGEYERYFVMIESPLVVLLLYLFNIKYLSVKYFKSS